MTVITANINTLWASLAVEELVRHGITQFVISPGSRCAPLVTAAANAEKARIVTHFDERGAAFFALGQARATGHPVALICTSGTAVANYLPAVVEAAVDMIPLILLTADRPPELRDTGANQTILQPGIFSHYVRWQCDLPCPTGDIPAEYVLTTVDQAIYRARLSPAGPVHLNFMFREPLAPIDIKGSFAGYMHSIDRWLTGNQPYTTYSLPRLTISSGLLDSLTEAIQKSLRGLLVVGQLRTEEERHAVAELSGRLGWPMLADITSGLRGGEVEYRIDYPDALLMSQRFIAQHEPDFILQLGTRLTSRRLSEYLSDSCPSRYVMVVDHPFRQDPTHRVTDHIQCSMTDFCTAFLARTTEHAPSPWYGDWRIISQQVDAYCEKAFTSSAELTEPVVAKMVSTELAPGSTLFLASSMPIRDMDQFVDPRSSWAPVVANRGVSGIDGTVATAAGYAYASGKPVVLLAGDLSVLHDLNSLALLKSSLIKLTIVILNNNGGGIFGHLPIAGFDDLFQKYFLTPHGLTFEHAAQQFGLAYQPINDINSFADTYRSVQRAAGSSIIEIPIPRQANQKFHTGLLEELAKHLDKD